jgi:hypothetical protein
MVFAHTRRVAASVTPCQANSILAVRFRVLNTERIYLSRNAQTSVAAWITYRGRSAELHDIKLCDRWMSCTHANRNGHIHSTASTLAANGDNDYEADTTSAPSPGPDVY